MKNTRSKMPTPSTTSESIADDGLLEDESQKSGTPDSAMPPPKKRHIGRKGLKEKLKSGTHIDAIHELLVLRQEENKMKEERWKEIKLLQERKLSIEKQKFQWEQEQKIMFCDASSLDPDVRTYVLAMRAQIAARKVAEVSRSNLGGGSTIFGGSSGGFGGATDGIRGDGLGRDGTSDFGGGDGSI